MFNLIISKFLFIIKPILLCFIFLIIINSLSRITSNNQIFKNINHSNEIREINQYDNLNSDMLTECALLYMSMKRNNIFHDMFGSNLNLYG